MSDYLVGGNDEPDEIFKSEPADENCFSNSEKVVFFVVVSFLRLFLWRNFFSNGHPQLCKCKEAEKKWEGGCRVK